MSTLKSNNEDMTINADGASSEIILQQNGTEIGRIGSGFAGTSGQVLTSNGAGAAPTMQDAAGDPLGFSAYMSSNQSISAATYTKLQYNTENFDTDSDYDTTNYRFTPSKSGKYLITASIRFDITNNNYVLFGLYKNGAQHRVIYAPTESTIGIDSPQMMEVVEANGTTDYFEIYVMVSTAETAVSSTLTSNFAGVKVA